MGFTTGLMGGTTATLGILYLSLAYHRQNRIQQAVALRQSSAVLNHVVDPEPPPPQPQPHEASAGIAEMVKDGWNRELQSIVRRLQTTDWRAVGDQTEAGVKNVWRRLTSS